MDWSSTAKTERKKDKEKWIVDSSASFRSKQFCLFVKWEHLLNWWFPRCVPGTLGAPPRHAQVWKGQNYFHNVTKMLFPFIFSLAHEYTMKFTRRHMTCIRSQWTEHRADRRTLLLKWGIKRCAKNIIK